MAGRSAPCTDRPCAILERGRMHLHVFYLPEVLFKPRASTLPLIRSRRIHPKEIPQDAALPVIKTRCHKKTCVGPVAWAVPIAGWRFSECLNSWRAGELDPTLQEDFVGPVDMHWHKREPGREERDFSSSDSERDMPARPRPWDAERQPNAPKRLTISVRDWTTSLNGARCSCGKGDREQEV